MKVNINKLQGGGLLSFTPVIRTDGQRGTAVPQTTSNDTESKSESQSLIDDVLYKDLVKNGGLVNDVNLFTAELNNGGNDPYAYLDPSNVSNKLRTLAKVNELKVNKEMWSESLKTATQSGGLGEVAVGPSGELYAKNESGRITSISASDYKKNSDKYKVMSVSELLNARQFDPQLSFKNGIFSVADNTVGMGKITEHIRTVVSKLGSIEESEEFYKSKREVSDEYAKSQGIDAPTTNQLQGIQEIANLAKSISGGADGVYKFKKSLSTQRGHTKEALNYIWNTLGKNAQDKLKAVMAVRGGDISDVEGLIKDALIIGTDHSTELSTDYEGESGAGGSASSSAGLGKMSNSEAFFSGAFDSKETFKWNSPSTGRSMDIPVTGKSILFSNDKPTGMVTLGQFNDTSTAQMLDTGNITFGGKKVSPWDMDKIVYDKGLSARALMPVNADGTPNYTLLEQFQEAQAVIKANPNWNKEKINDFYADRAMPFVQVDDSKSIIPSQYVKPFLVFHAWTTDQTEATNKNDNIQELESGEESKVKDMLEPFFEQSNLPVPTNFFGNDFYKGIVAYPIMSDAPAKAKAIEGHLYSPKIDISTVKSHISKSNAKPVYQNSAQLLM